MMVKRAIVFFGEAGAGKSSLLNKITGELTSTVGNQLLEDGTKKVIPYHHEFEACKYCLIDTPGLTSECTFDSASLKRELGKEGLSEFLAVLVLNCKSGRLNGEMRKKLTSVLSMFQPKLIVVWSHSDALLPQYVKIREYERELREGNFFPSFLVFGEVEPFKPDNFCEYLPDLLSKDSNFSTFQVVRPIAESKTQQKKNTTNSTGKSKKHLIVNGKGIIDRKNHAWKENKDTGDKWIASVVPKVKALISTKKYAYLKRCGDALLEYLAIKYVNEQISENEDMNEAIQTFTSNDDNGVLNKFYNKHVKSIDPPSDSNDSTGPNHYNSHSKADFVEALLQYTQDHEPSIFAYVCKELICIYDDIRKATPTTK